MTDTAGYPIVVEVMGRYSNHQAVLNRLFSVLSEVGGRQETPQRGRRQKQTRLDRDAQSLLIEQYVAGTEAATLARAFGVHPDTVRAIVTKAGVRRYRRILTDADLIEARELLTAGASMREIGKQLGVASDTIKRHLGRLEATEL